MPYSVSQVAGYLGVSANTIRNWGEEFAAHLSASANPASGIPREYGEEDLAVLETVAVLRDQHVPYEEIRESLAAGERLEFQERPAAAENKLKGIAEGAGSETALVTESFAQALQAYDRQVTRLQDRIEKLEEARLEAEKRATAAETELRVLRERSRAQEPAGAESGATAGNVTEVEEEGQGRPWWAFWRA